MGKNDQKQQDALPIETPSALPAGELATVSELAVKHGQTFHQRGKDGKLYPTVPSHDSVFRRNHLLADVIHGWTKSELHTSLPVRLSDEDYVAAIEAVKIGKTHAPANKRAADEAAKGA